MRILVYPHELEIGGVPLNAIDLADAVRRRGHETEVYGIPGPLVERVHALGLPFHPAHPLRYRPAPTRIVQLTRLAKDLDVDLVHSYEWPPALDAFLGPHVQRGTAQVCTVLSMGLSPLVPGSLPLVMGTEELADQARRVRHGCVVAIEPPVDVEADAPTVDGSAFRQRLGIRSTELVVASVSRLALDMKLDSLVRAIDAAAALADRFPVRLLVVGGGEAQQQLEARASFVNTAARREVVTLTGPLDDPSEAYAAADVAVGMGSSIMRAMAFGKPAIVQGVGGFAEIFTPQTEPLFLRQGFFGRGDDRPAAERLATLLGELLADPVRRAELGAFGRQVVVDRLSLEGAADRLVSVYDRAVERRPRRRRSLAREAATMSLRAVLAEARLHDPRDKRSRRLEREQLLARAASL